MKRWKLRWTPEMDEYLVKKRREGQTYGQIALVLGCSRSAACSRFRLLVPNAPPCYVPRRRVHSMETREAVLKMRSDGMSLLQIANELGLRRWQVCGIWNHWRDYVLPRRLAA